jgi:hypothetical protein
MTLTPFRVILGLNLIVVVAGLVIAYGGGAMHDNGGKIVTLLMPFAVSLIDLVLGIACLVLMPILRLVSREASAGAKTYMQAFMASFGLVLIIAVPACFAGMGIS